MDLASMVADSSTSAPATTTTMTASQAPVKTEEDDGGGNSLFRQPQAQLSAGASAAADAAIAAATAVPQGQLSAGASAADAAAIAAATAAANASATSTANASAVTAGAPSTDPNSIQSILANNMPMHLLDRSTAATATTTYSMPPPGMDAAAAPTGAPAVGAVAAAAAANQHHPVAEFLYQLTKMLTDDNSEIIEWIDGRIKVHYPERLEDEVLHKYFRHSKFASFQRQLNYFGFRKIAGKGKMSPCSYVNESATSDIRSLLLIKRKTNGSAARKAMAQRAAAAFQLTNDLGEVGMVNAMVNPALGTGLPGLAGLSLQLQMQKQLGAHAMAALQGSNALGGTSGLDQIPSAANNIVSSSSNNNNNSAHANPLSQLLMQNQQAAYSFRDLQYLGMGAGPAPAAPAPNGGMYQPPPAMATLEQLQAQLAQLQSQAAAAGGVDGAASAALNAAALNLAQASGGLAQLMPNFGPGSAAATAAGVAGDNPATAALNASAAVDNPASTAAAQLTNMNSFFESATNLKALIGNDQTVGPIDAQKAAASALNGASSTNAFPGSISNVSLGNLLSSNARLSSLLSLNSFLSREPSLADLAMWQPNARGNSVNQFAAFQQHAAQQQQQHQQQQQLNAASSLASSMAGLAAPVSNGNAPNTAPGPASS